jgi:hypothetical protein
MRRLNENGRLYEIPILIIVAFVVGSVALGQKSFAKGLLAAAMIVGVLVGLVGILFALGWILERPWVQRLGEWKGFKVFWDWLPVLLLSAFLGAAGAFFGLVMADIFNPPEQAQMTIAIASAGALGLIPILYKLLAKKKTP